MKRIIRAASKQPIIGAHMYVHDLDLKELLASDLFEFMDDAYKYIGGFQSFTDEDDFAYRSYLWYITYQGQLPTREADIDINKVYTVSVYKQKYGLKLVGIGNNRFSTVPEEDRMDLKMNARNALRDHISFAVNHGWAEVSGAVEKMFQLQVPNKYIIDPEDLKQFVPEFEDIEILPDNIHYSRVLSSGKEVTKVAYGTIRLD